ncbi:hypothetical protein D9756_011501 [Leucocoprinus leucothites]|uniref:Pheromone receptor n=1 Tax=Leucocoprinus leucothites TaxID=201217 RepID=A0A8H5CN73_9AGAR|nr:hypothetical protein D9756_011501 [Leucoagaricus leucothites]
MLLIQVSHILIFALTFLPSLISARGRGHGGGGGGSFGGSGGDSDFSLEPFYAAIFAFNVIFAVVTALQALIAFSNSCRRVSKMPPSIATVEYSVGPIFPICLLIATLLLTTTYGLVATYVGKTYNTLAEEVGSLSTSFFVAWDAMAYLADIFLISSILALLSCREKIVLCTPPWIRDVKGIADAILVVILLALSMRVVRMQMAYLTTPGPAEAEAETVDHLVIAYYSFLFLASVNIAVTSTMLYVRARKSPRVNDHFIIRRCAFIISPLFMVYTLFLLISNVQSKKVPFGREDVIKQWNLASVIIGCITEAIIIGASLGFGMPPLPKKNKEGV